MRLASVLLIVPVAVSLAVPVHADPSGDDADFLTGLKQAGITYTNGDRAVAAGKGICDQMDHGQSATDVVKNLTDANGGFTPNGAAKFTVIAVSAYCPKHLGNDSGEAVNDIGGVGDSGGGGPGGG